jgi:hypothetical protein
MWHLPSLDSMGVTSSCNAGSGGEEAVLESPLATLRVHPVRCRGNTFSPPDTLRDSMALFLQVGTLHDFLQLASGFPVVQCLGQR